MTHMRWRQGYIWAREHGLHSVVWSLCVGGLKAWFIDGCSSKDARKVERDTPTPCGKRNWCNQKNNTPVDPKPRTHTKPATTPISKCSQLSHTHAIELATLQRSLLNAVSHFLSPTSLFLSVLLHVFALFSSLGMKILLSAFPLSSSSTPRLFYLHRFLFMVPHVCCSYSFFLAVSSLAFATCLSRFFFLSAMLLSPSVSSFSLLLLTFFCRTSLTRSRWLQPFAPQPVLPAPLRPTSMRTSTSLRASCQARSLLAGPRFLPFGGLCQMAWKRRQ